MTTTMISMKIVPRVSIRTRNRKTNDKLTHQWKFICNFSFEKSANSTECGQCTWTGSNACTVECILSIKNEIAVGAGGYETFKTGYPAIGHHLYITIAIVFSKRWCNASRRDLQWRSHADDQCKSTESGEHVYLFFWLSVALSDVQLACVH